jgi:hypothetical protein
MSAGCDLVRASSVYAALLALVVSLFLCASPQTASAQESLPPVMTLQNPSSGENLTRFFTTKTPYEFWLTCLIGVLGLAVIGALVVALRQANNTRAEDISRPVIVITVIIGTLMLVTVGYSNEQIAPAFGLFGTIVGYMLGRLSQPQPSTNVQPDAPQGVRPGPHNIGRAPDQDEARNAGR